MMNEFQGSYNTPFSRTRRGLFVFLLNQSASMGEKVEGKNYTIAELATAIINSLIYSIIDDASLDPLTYKRKDYCDIAVFGYGDQIIPLLNSIGTPVSIT